MGDEDGLTTIYFDTIKEEETLFNNGKKICQKVWFEDGRLNEELEYNEYFM
ncbi:MAG: antitoxin component YwqK of YwqJK toxin-antitoxin module [Salibacteraceae bacterium]|jgi:antitoxin component YwqK of YwqJK toxin-antitoxin module